MKKHGFRVKATCKTDKRLKELLSMGLDATLDNREAACWADVVFIAVKPGQVGEVLKEIAGCVKGKLLISVAAAVTTGYIESLVDARVVRAMPNINAAVGHSATAVSGGKSSTREDVEAALHLFSMIGYAVELDEKYLDAVTAFSGSGPAYVLQFYEALLLAGLKVGLPRRAVEELALHTIAGTARLLEEMSEHPAGLRDMVITPGGVTIDAIHVMEEKGFKAILMSAVEKAYEKSAAISKLISGGK